MRFPAAEEPLCPDRCEARLCWFGDRVVPLPSLVLQLDVLDSHSIRIRIEIRQSLILRNPCAIDLVADGQLSGLVVEVDDKVLAKIFERDLRAQAGTDLPDLRCPLFEIHIMGDAAFKRDGVELGSTGRFAWLSSCHTSRSKHPSESDLERPPCGIGVA